MKKRLTEAEITRLQIEQVFLLTGGELNDKPWAASAAFAEDGHEIEYPSLRTFPFNYDGWPEYASVDFDDADDFDFVTVVTNELYGRSPEILIDDSDGLIWRRVQSYVSGGEVECPFQNWHPIFKDVRNGVVDRHTSQLQEKSEVRHERPRWYGDRRPDARHACCVYCEERIGEEHGYVYLGDGECEVVYARVGYVRGRGKVYRVEWFDDSNADGDPLSGMLPRRFQDENSAEEAANTWREAKIRADIRPTEARDRDLYTFEVIEEIA